MKKYIDLRSDTVTQPTDEMRQAMVSACVGDDVYGEDPEINRLQELAAQVTGKEAALFVPSGTMGNQLAIFTHTNRGDEIIAGAWSHIVHHEAGGPALLSGVGIRTVDNPDQIIYPQDIMRACRPRDDIHQPLTTLLCLENALATGRVVPLAVLREDYRTAGQLGLKVHMDGARLFNAAICLGVDVKEIAACTDSLMFCLSKGLCAPVGSMLCGTQEFIRRALRGRKVLGGGMRQAGFLGVCGQIAIEKMTQRLGEDHANAAYLAKGLAKLPEVKLDLDSVKINMVFFSIQKQDFQPEAFEQYLWQNGVKCSSFDNGTLRFVTNRDVSSQDIDRVLTLISAYFA